MAKKVIAEFDINTSEVYGKIIALRKKIDALAVSQAELLKQGKRLSSAYVDNVVRQKELSKELGVHVNIAKSAIAADNQRIATARAITSLLSQEAKTIVEATANTRALTYARNNLNASTAAGASSISQINKKIDQNTKFIKENSAVIAKSATAADNQRIAATRTITSLLSQEAKTIAEATANTRALISARNNLNVSTAAGASSILQINKKIDQNTKFIKENSAVIAKSAIATDNQRIATTRTITSLLSQEAKTIAEATANTRALISARNNLNASTPAGASSILQINKKIDQNTKFIKENSAGFERLKYNIGDYRRGIVEALASTSGFGFAVQRVSTIFSGATAAVGAAVAGFLALGAATIKVSAQAEDSMVSVRRVAGLTADEAKQLTEELKSIGTRTDLEGLIKLAKVAGELGVNGVPQIAAFASKLNAIKLALGDSLGANAEEAITRLVKISKLSGAADTFGMAEGIERTGSALATLADVGVATGAFVSEFGEKVAGIGKQFNLSTPAILAFGAALEESGQEPAVSATAVISLFQKMGEDIPRYASIAKMSVQDFSLTLAKAPEQAFIKVLGGLKSFGGGVEEITEKLKDAGIVEDRQTRVIAALASNYGTLSERVSQATTAFNENSKIRNSALVTETTTLGQLSLLWNSIRNSIVSSPVNDFIKSSLVYINSAIATYKGYIGLQSRLWQAFAAGKDNAANRPQKASNESVKGVTDMLLPSSDIERIKENKAIKDDLDLKTALTKKEKEAQDYFRELASKKRKEDRALEIKERLEVLAESKNLDAISLSAQRRYYNEIKALKLEQIAIDGEMTEREKRQKSKIVSIQYDASIKDVSEKEKKEAIAKLQQEAKLKLDIAKNELDNYVKLNKQQLQADKFMTNEIYNNRLDISAKTTELEARGNQLSYEAGVISYEEYLSNREAIYSQHKERVAVIEQTAIDQENVRLAANEQLKIEIMNQSEGLRFEARKAALTREYDAEIMAAEKTGAGKQAIKRKYELGIARIEQDKQMQTLDGARQTFSVLKGLQAEHTDFYKASAVAEATIATWLGAIKAYEQYGPILGAVLAASIVAAGALSVANILSVEAPASTSTEAAQGPASNVNIRKASNGMFIGGPSHANGGVMVNSPSGKIEAEGGEVIINKRSSQLFLPLLSKINEVGGGVKFAAGGVMPSSIASANALTSRMLSVKGNEAVALDAIVDKINNMKVAVVTDDVINGVYKRTQMLDRAKV